ncbi:hypothetical protein ABZP36_009272 [Zizania latifolia]
MEATTGRFLLPHATYGRPEPAAAAAAAATELFVSVPLPHEHFQRTTGVRHRTVATAASQAPRRQRQFMWPVRAAQGAGRAAAALPRSDAAVPRVEHEQHSDDEFGFVPASSRAISALEETTAGEASEVEGCCSVCQEDFEGGDELRKMPCSHVFHESCITDWLWVSHLCPLCRLALPTDADEEHLRRSNYENTISFLRMMNA